MKLIHRLCISLALMFSLSVIPACGILHAAIPVIDEVVTVIDDADKILDTVDAAASTFFLVRPDADLQKKYDKAMGRCRVSLQVALHVAHGAKNLDEEQSAAAFEDFRTAYTDLVGLLGSAGLMSPAGQLKATPGAQTIAVPKPLAFSMHGAKK